jgi:hypothetical protein
MDEVGFIQATLDAIGESDTELGGLYLTRLTAAVVRATDLPDGYEWDGTDKVISYRNPTELSVDDWIQLDEEGRAFKVEAITYNGGAGYWEVEIDTRGLIPPTTKIDVPSTTMTWNGTTTVTVSAGDQTLFWVGAWIRLTSDGQWFEVVELLTNALKITNPHSLTIPTGATGSERSVNPVTSLVTTSVDVETTLNWPELGEVAIDGVLYGYGSKTLDPPSIDEIFYVDGGEVRYGLKRSHTLGAVVTDLSKARSALELSRRGMLVAFALSEDLNAIGRNYGVLRYPFLESDDIFREIVQALAYNPRGTMFGLELALDAMVGEGNYELYEDLVNFPCTVFVKLIGDAAVTDRSEGKTFLSGPNFYDPTSTTLVTINETIINRGHVHGVRLKTEDWFSDFRNQKPSADMITEISGSPDNVWTYVGGTESSDVTLYAGEGVEIIHQAAQNSYYNHPTRILDESYVALNCVMRVESGSTLGSISFLDQWCMRWEDGNFRGGWGTYEVSAFAYALVLYSGTPILGATAITLTKGVYYTVEIRKYGTKHVELWVDGALVDRLPYSYFASATTATAVLFGIASTGAPTTVTARIRHVGYYVKTDRDYWGYRDTSAQTNAANDKRITASASYFVSGDVGKRIELSEASTANSQGGNNNGIYEVDSYISGTAVDVKGPTNVGADVQTPNPLRIVVDLRGQQFVFPDDLGKEIVISNSAQGNNGTYEIDKLLDPDTLVDLESWDTALKQKTNVCVITEPFAGFEFVSETDLTWRLDPVFVTETGLQTDLSDAGSFLSSNLTLRDPLPSASWYVQTVVSEVLSALILLDFSVKNIQTQVLPTIEWAYYPFYLSDPLGFIKAYLDDITAAGVIPEYSVE